MVALGRVHFLIPLAIVCACHVGWTGATHASDFSYSMIKEGGPGGYDEVTGTGHEHAVIKCKEIPFWILRTKKPFESIAIRAEAVVAQLDELESTLSGVERESRVGHEHEGLTLGLLPTSVGSKPGLQVYAEIADGDRFLLVRMGSGDVWGYDQRSDVDVDLDLLGEWWRDVLEDVLAMVFFGDDPKHILGTPEGALLSNLVKAARVRSESEVPSVADIRQSLDEMALEDIAIIRNAARKVPSGYHPESQAEEEHAE